MGSGSTHQAKRTDVIIIGGGPAGISAAIWCSDLGLKATLIERDRLGGQLHSIHNPIKNYPGVGSISGIDLCTNMQTQAAAAGIQIITGRLISKVSLADHLVEMVDGYMLHGRSLIIATGVRRRKLNVPGEQRFLHHGIITSGALERLKVSGKNVVIIGGGDAALENVLILSEFARSVTLVHRGHKLSARDEFVSEARLRPNVDLMLGAVVTGFYGEDVLQRIELVKGDAKISIRCDNALVRIGVEPNTDIFSNELGLRVGDYIDINSRCMTRIEGVFAIGDVANTGAPTIASAAGMAATAVKNIERLLARDVTPHLGC